MDAESGPAKEPDFNILSAQTILRLTTIIGGYVLLRPLIEMVFRKLFATSEPAPTPASLNTQSPAAKVLADEEIVEDPASGRISAADSAPEASATGTSGIEWGDAARHRQVKFIEFWEAERARLAEEEDLEDIADLLED